MSTGQNIWESTATFLQKRSFPKLRVTYEKEVGMKITEMIEELNEFKEKNGDVEVLIEHRLYGIVPAVVGLTIDRGIDEVLIES